MSTEDDDDFHCSGSQPKCHVCGKYWFTCDCPICKVCDSQPVECVCDV